MRTTTRLEVESTTEFDGGGLMQVSIHVGDLGTTTDAERQLLSTLLGQLGGIVDLAPAVEGPATTSRDELRARAGVNEEPPAIEPPAPVEKVDEPKKKPARAARTKSKDLRRDPGKASSEGAVRLLRGLHELGGEILDPSGRATSKLLEHVAWDRSDAVARNLLAALADAGHITRTVNSKRTTRLALRPSGMAVLNQLDDADASRRAAEQLDGDLGPTIEPSGLPTCPRCSREFKHNAEKRLRAHLVNAHGIDDVEARRMVKELTAA